MTPTTLPTKRVVVVGAGAGGLAAAAELATNGFAVTLLDRAPAPGGKLRRVQAGPAFIDGGPTVFTMRYVFDSLFEACGTTVADHLTLQPVEILARHAWDQHGHLDLFADIDRSADAIGAFAGAGEARGYRAFVARAGKIFRSLDLTFMRAQQPGSAFALARRVGAPGDLFGMNPFATMWSAIGEHFHDPRLRQLFGRYATYCGGSPFQAPGTMILVAHAEQQGVWLVEGGMHQIAVAIAGLAERAGATLRWGTEVSEILVRGGAATGVKLRSGEEIPADAVVFNGDVSALAGGLLGTAATSAVALKASPRSLSALTWTTHAPTSGFPLLRHSVFFSRDYAAEFAQLFERRAIPHEPTVYICAQDRDDRDTKREGPERLLILVNAPAIGDAHDFSPGEIAQCQDRTFSLLRRCGLTITLPPDATVITTPTQWNNLFPATGGALYGQAPHGSLSPFRRPGSRSRLKGLYLAGGSAHPGPGVPMATLSGRLAAASVMADLTSPSKSGRTATPGGISTR